MLRVHDKAINAKRNKMHLWFTFNKWINVDIFASHLGSKYGALYKLVVTNNLELVWCLYQWLILKMVVINNFLAGKYF